MTDATYKLFDRQLSAEELASLFIYDSTSNTAAVPTATTTDPGEVWARPHFFSGDAMPMGNWMVPEEPARSLWGVKADDMDGWQAAMDQLTRMINAVPGCGTTVPEGENPLDALDHLLSEMVTLQTLYRNLLDTSEALVDQNKTLLAEFEDLRAERDALVARLDQISCDQQRFRSVFDALDTGRPTATRAMMKTFDNPSPPAGDNWRLPFTRMGEDK